MISRIPNDPSLSGAIVLMMYDSFLSKQIDMHMTIYGLQRFRKPLHYSHAETLIWSERNQTLYTSGARKNDAKAIPVDIFYADEDIRDILVLRPVVPLTPQENEMLWNYYDEVCNNPYQVGNFPAWITYMKTLVWISTKGDTLIYCFELAGRYSNEINRWYTTKRKRNLDHVTSYALFDNPRYKTDPLIHSL